MSYTVTYDIKGVDEIFRYDTPIDEGPRGVIEAAFEQTQQALCSHAITEESSLWVWFLSEENEFVARTFRAQWSAMSIG